MTPSYDPTLLPTLVEMNETWTHTSDITLWDFADFNGSTELAYAFASIFSPDLIEHEGGIFLEARFRPESFSQWMDSLDGDLTRVESVMNHVHIWDLFPARDNADVPSSVEKRIGEALASCWRGAVRERFPELPAVVSWNGDDESDGDFQLTLYLDRSG